MIDREREAFRTLLLDLQVELQQRESEFAQDSQPVELDQAKVGRLSRMDAIQGQQMALESSRRRRQQLILIGQALRRLDAGDFGYCPGCDEEIDVRRLRADPTSVYCISCAQKL